MAKIPTLTFPGLASQQTVVRLSANGARMICADGLGNLRAWEIAAPPGPDEVASGRVDPGRLFLISKLRDGVSGIRAVAIDRSGCRAVSLGSDGTVRGWDLDRGDHASPVDPDADDVGRARQSHHPLEDPFRGVDPADAVIPRQSMTPGTSR